MLLIKLGGSLFSDKTKPKSFYQEIVEQVAQQVKTYRQQHPDTPIILGHGAGSFAHVPAKRYQTNRGFINADSKMGFCYVRQEVMQLNNLITDLLLKSKLPIVSIAPSATFVTKNANIKRHYSQSIQLLLMENFIPLVFGDAVMDINQGCVILSTDTILAYLAKKIKMQKENTKNNNFETSKPSDGKDGAGSFETKIIHLTNVDGVLDDHQQVIPQISHNNLKDIKSHIGTSAGTDVTGGMLFKVQESLKLTKHGITTHIINGRTPNNITNLLQGKTIGTIIA
jgi:isopentenyl phosphate kinase